jgi:hypothetical protein
MYDAKGRKSQHVHCTAVRVNNGHLVDVAREAGREGRGLDWTAAG